MEIKTLTESDHTAWDAYAHSHPDANLYHLSGWKTVIEKSYCHKTFYLMAATPKGAVSGILPLVHMKHFLFGNRLVSIPFFDMGGLLADSIETEKALIERATLLANDLGAEMIELRHAQPHPWIDDQGQNSRGQGFEDSRGINQTIKQKSGVRSQNPNTLNQSPQQRTQQTQITKITRKTNKVRMLLDLPDSSEALMKSFKSKLRSQIRRPIKEGLHAKIGSLDLMADFYAVFCVNMRDLGSPVHSRKLLETVLSVFDEKAKLVVVYKEELPVACSLIIGFKDTLENPWASSLRQYSRISPNMLLYWTMLEHACDKGYRIFDFGRSTPGEGTYNFKKQWGAQPHPLYWYALSPSRRGSSTGEVERSKFDKAIEFWQKLPVPITRRLGPMIRKHIAL